MSETFAANEFLLNVATWAEAGNDPNDGAGKAAAVGSIFFEQGNYPLVPTELHLKLFGDDHGWYKQNLVNLDVFNVQDYGAVGDGVTDDTAAINLAVVAANANGGGIVYFPPVNVGAGQFYKVTNATLYNGAYMSIPLDNVHNITFLGDGFASMVGAVGDALGLNWSVFRAFDGSTNISWINLRVVGSGMANTDVAGNSFVISAAGDSFDPLAGMTNFAVTGCYIGPATRRLINVSGNVIGYTVTDASVRYNAIDHSQTTNTTSAVVMGNFSDRCVIARNYLAEGDATGLVCTTNGLIIPATTRWSISGNHLNHTVFVQQRQGIGSSLGLIEYNTTSGGALQIANSNAVNRGLLIRGNVVVQPNGNASQLVSCSTAVAVGENAAIIGNVGANTDVTAAPTQAISLNAAAGGFGTGRIAENITERGSTASLSLIVTPATNAFAVNISGNIAICTACLAASGAAFRTQLIDQAPSVAMIGNLSINTGNAISNLNTGCEATVAAGAPRGRLTEINYNLIDRCRRAISYSTGTFIEWRSGTYNNNIPSASETATIGFPTGNIGVTGEGPAGPGSQLCMNSVSPVGVCTSPKGSLCTNTTGGPAATLFYKESDSVAVSGGTALWLGVGGFNRTFGARASSTATAARFLAPGMALAAESTVEIQMALSRPCTIRNLRVRWVAGTGAATDTVTVRKNGVNTALTVGISNTATTGNDTTHSFTAVAGDLLSVSITKSAAPTAGPTSIRAVMEIV